MGEITPLFKKGNSFEAKNYRPISVLTCISKVFESIFTDQLSVFFEGIFSKYLSGYHRKHSCQSVLLNFVDNCKKSLDNQQIYAAILPDLSKAFDSLPYGLLISKFHAYGINDDACKLISNYLWFRQQRVKLGNIRSEWVNLTKGTPQGSIFGPFAFNVFQNDLMFLLEKECDVYNYADDNSIGCSGKSLEDVHLKLQNAANIMIKWFQTNSLQANGSKFQTIVFSRMNKDNVPI